MHSQLSALLAASPLPPGDGYRIMETGTGAIYLVDPLNQTIAEIYNAPDANFICTLLNNNIRNADADKVLLIIAVLSQVRSSVGHAVTLIDELACRQPTPQSRPRLNRFWGAAMMLQ